MVNDKTNQNLCKGFSAKTQILPLWRGQVCRCGPIRPGIPIPRHAGVTSASDGCGCGTVWVGWVCACLGAFVGACMSVGAYVPCMCEGFALRVCVCWQWGALGKCIPIELRSVHASAALPVPGPWPCVAYVSPLCLGLYDFLYGCVYFSFTFRFEACTSKCMHDV